jgi:hypothetical protein
MTGQKFRTSEGKLIESKFSIGELWENQRKVSLYLDGSDSAYLIGCDYLSYNRTGTFMYYHEMKLIKIRDIVECTESLKKVPVYKELTTQAPPVDCSQLENGKYKLHNGHRRYASAKARKEKLIFVEIIHRVTIEKE